ncbi:MAG: twin-arginine translocase TatA/TatE family subunit [Myxococcota bacterium]
MLTQPDIHLAFIGGLGPVELIIILVIVLLIFGPMKLPQIGDALGKSVRSFRGAVSSKDDEPVDVTPKSIEEGKDEAQTVEVDEEGAEKKKTSRAEERKEA